jgi:hypothetical protein
MTPAMSRRCPQCIWGVTIRLCLILHLAVIISHKHTIQEDPDLWRLCCRGELTRAVSCNSGKKSTLEIREAPR